MGQAHKVCAGVKPISERSKPYPKPGTVVQQHNKKTKRKSQLYSDLTLEIDTKISHNKRIIPETTRSIDLEKVLALSVC